MTKAIVLRAPGGPEALALEDIEVGAPGTGEVRVRQTAAGVNFHDCYVRSGLYATLPLPGVPGLEAAGVVEAVGPGVDTVAPGDRVAYFTSAYGAYAAERLIGADRLLAVPDAVDDLTASVALIRGLTAHVLVSRVHRVEPGQTVLVHAAAGGVGLLLCQWARALGARVIGTAGSMEKAERAKAAGCEDVVLYREQDFVARVQDLTNGAGVHAVYDAVGRDTFSGSLACLADLGHLVNYGQASGPVPPFEIAALSKGSYSVTRPMLFHYVADRPSLEAAAVALFAALAEGTIVIDRPTVYPLADAGEAHRALEARETSGAVALAV